MVVLLMKLTRILLSLGLEIVGQRTRTRYEIKTSHVGILEATRDEAASRRHTARGTSKELNSYTCRPALVYQRVGPSDIATFNRGHLGLGHPLYSSDRVPHVWATSELNVPLSFPNISLKTKVFIS